MLFCHFGGIVKFMVGFFLVSTSRNLVVYVLGLCLSFSYTQLKNPKNVVSLKIGLLHVLIDV
jgi:hypothetical protein